jgi:tripartite-type tricarboxylate transporter receptor subunit TctC
VPYKGGGPAAQALAANEVQLTRFGVGNFLGLIEAGKVKALAVSADKRSSLLPNVPTFGEAGLGGYPGQGWWGLAAPRGTPQPVIDKVSAEFVKLFSEPKFVEFLEQHAVVSAPTTPAGFAAFLKEDRKAAESLIEIANTKREEYKPN